ncbi:MAG: DUF454 family protein [Gammaproteobacteria bacterium]|nr:DUF454 family protein [Gammaproteobacteria bacterium]
MKIVYLALALCFLMLGVIGLVFPLIPGILFLVGGVYLLGKVSRRIKAWSASSPTYTGVERRVALLGGVGWLDRMRLGSLMALDAVVRGVDSVMSGIGRFVARKS